MCYIRGLTSNSTPFMQEKDMAEPVKKKKGGMGGCLLMVIAVVVLVLGVSAGCLITAKGAISAVTSLDDFQKVTIPSDKPQEIEIKEAAKNTVLYSYTTTEGVAPKLTADFELTITYNGKAIPLTTITGETKYHISAMRICEFTAPEPGKYIVTGRATPPVTLVIGSMSMGTAITGIIVMVIAFVIFFIMFLVGIIKLVTKKKQAPAQ